MNSKGNQKAKVRQDNINYIGEGNFLRSEGYLSSDGSPIDYVTLKKQHDLKQIFYPERTADREDLDFEGEFGIAPLLDYPYGVNNFALKLALIDLANTIARLTGSYPDHETMKMNVARIFYSAIRDAEDFIDDFPELNPFEEDDDE